MLARRFEYKVINTDKDVEDQLNDLGAEGWQVVGVTTRKQLLLAAPAAIILMREVVREVTHTVTASRQEQAV